ncbi:hypothetical protein C488_21127 [Natrinema pellirubrum DSM 15624]|uniref:Uncharacterized protein n=1 Tax=Natrinema pellirubrum (strain DSM 15624 / CIP 106293 / JCM 10476 / NCIMB 786 / 157) TaxID=797303 RepID=L9Y3K7_NATP1|nr:hypothetical protein C488_21127 [Natrinema pellirubrum DSM 15624]
MDWSFILRFDRISFTPLPVIVAVVVDLLHCDRGFRGDIVWEVLRSLLDRVFLVLLFSKTCFALPILGKFLGVTSDVPE